MKNILWKNKLEQKESCMSKDILKLIKERNSQRKKDYRIYKIPNKNGITEKCREAKEILMKKIKERIPD